MKYFLKENSNYKTLFTLIIISFQCIVATCPRCVSIDNEVAVSNYLRNKDEPQSGGLEWHLDQVESDYCVVGAGCAGATAALRVFQAGHTVALLEARDRVGGRVWTREHSGIPIDYGGQWLGSGQERAYALVKELGIQTYPTWTKGHNVFVISGKVRKYREIPQADPISILNLGLVLRQFAKWS